MPDRLSIINDALSNTGNNLVQVEFEDSDEWDVAKRAYDRFLPQLIEAHPWPFATITEPITKLPDSDNPSERYAHAYTIPANALWLQAAFKNGRTIDYEIIDDKLCTDADNASASITAKYVRVPGTDAMSNLFFEALRKLVESGCLRGLNEENSEATRREQEGWQMLRLAASRADQQSPRRGFLVSHAVAARRGGRYRSRGGQ